MKWVNLVTTNVKLKYGNLTKKNLTPKLFANGAFPADEIPHRLARMHAVIFS